MVDDFMFQWSIEGQLYATIEGKGTYETEKGCVESSSARMPSEKTFRI
jgi:hypothetical protein